jgi:hypothetical protein
VYAWTGVSKERLNSSSVSNKEKMIGEVFTPANYYPGSASSPNDPNNLNLIIPATLIALITLMALITLITLITLIALTTAIGTVNDKALTKPGVLFLVAKMMFCFATTGQSVLNEDAKAMVKEITAMDAKYLTLHEDILRVMQDPASVCDALWKVRALLYVGHWTEAASATVLAVKDKPQWKISGY